MKITMKAVAVGQAKVLAKTMMISAPISQLIGHGTIHLLEKKYGSIEKAPIASRTILGIAGAALSLVAYSAIYDKFDAKNERKYFQQREKNLKTMLANSDAMADRNLEWFEEEMDKANRLEIEVYELTGQIHQLENELDDLKMNNKEEKRRNSFGTSGSEEL